MVSAVTPTIDIVEMGFDDYLTKPVDKTELNEVVERLLDLNTYDNLVEEYYRLTSKKAALEVEHAGIDHAKKEVYERLTNWIDELEKELQRTQETVSETDFRRLFDRPEIRTHGG